MQEKHILLVDDDPELGQLLATTLATRELAITQASSGDEALRLADRLHPDLIILDRRLIPEQPDGLEVCRRLRANPATASSRILMLTGATRPEERDAALQAGIDDYLTKPFSPLVLLNYVYRALFT